MKKLLALALVVVLALSMAACGGSKLKDGTYVAETSDAVATDSHGWKDTVTVTVSGGKVTDVVFDSFALDDGRAKSKETAETYPMDPHPSEWIPQLSANLKAASSADEVAAVAGATHSSESAKKLYAAALEAAAEGNTETVVVD